MVYIGRRNPIASIKTFVFYDYKVAARARQVAQNENDRGHADQQDSQGATQLGAKT